jgi:hypothetical protein
MKGFFDLTFVWFFVITGIGTAGAFLYAFCPRWTVVTIGKIPFVREYTPYSALGDHGGPDGRLHDSRRI